jgi:hypothetical protein
MTTENSLGRAYAAIGQNIDQAEAYLAGTRADPPDANLLSRDHALPGGTILHIACGEDEIGPYAAIKIEHGDDDHDPRLFDPWCVPAILLEEIAGLSLQWHRTVQKGKVYLRLMLTPPDRSASLGIPVARTIANSPLGTATLFGRGHKDMRRSALIFASATHRPYPPKFGRDDAIQLTCEFYEKSGLAAVLGISPSAFKAQLERAYKVADEMHARLYSDEAD